jgi:AraC-like DNA-binding protein
MTTLIRIASTIRSGIALIDMSNLSDDLAWSEWRRTRNEDWLTVVYGDTRKADRRLLLDRLAECPSQACIGVGVGWPAAHNALSRGVRAVRGSCRMLPFLAPRLASLTSDPLAFALLQVYASSDGASSLKSLSGRCGLTPTHARRLMRAAGVTSSHLFFSAARVLRAHDSVSDRRTPLAEVALTFGFGTPVTLRREWNCVMGAPISTARGTALSDVAVAGVAQRVIDGLS